jgi:hypothetical protein
LDSLQKPVLGGYWLLAGRDVPSHRGIAHLLDLDSNCVGVGWISLEIDVPMDVTLLETVSHEDSYVKIRVNHCPLRPIGESIEGHRWLSLSGSFVLRFMRLLADDDASKPHFTGFILGHQIDLSEKSRVSGSPHTKGTRPNHQWICHGLRSVIAEESLSGPSSGVIERLNPDEVWADDCHAREELDLGFSGGFQNGGSNQTLPIIGQSTTTTAAATATSFEVGRI